jgi:hypothetical protein
VHLRCPHCRAPIPEHAARCPVCRRDPHVAPLDGPSPALLAPKYDVPTSATPASDDGGLWWRAGAALALVAIVALALMGAGALLAAAGVGEVAWPALAGLAFALVAGAVVLVERQRARLLAAAASAATPPEPAAAADVALIYLYAHRFAAPSRRREGVPAPLTHTSVNAEDVAWRVIAATLTALADDAIVELDEHALATTAGPVQAVAVRLVRPLPAGEAFAAKLLRPLVRRGVGGSTTVSEVVSQLAMAWRRPAVAVLALAREQALVRGYLRVPGAGGGTPGAFARGWLAAALRLPARVDRARLTDAAPALAALEERLALWDARDLALVAALRAEVRAAFVREHARAVHGST